MTPQELYETWAPPGAIWSPWAKPVIFAQMHLSKRKPAPPPGGGTGVLPPDTRTAPTSPSTLDGLLASQSQPQSQPQPQVQPQEVVLEPQASFSWARDYLGDTAIVIDLPGEMSVEAAMQLTNYGFRPVPLYNCANSDLPVLVVPTFDLVQSLARNGPLLSSASLAPDAPPAFMLDSNRNSVLAPKADEFDNRWVIFPQDFPSATFLQAQNIRRVLVVQGQRKGMMTPEIQADLYEVARRWHGGGLEIATREMPVPEPVETGPKPFFSSESSMSYRPLTFGPLSRFRLGAAGYAATVFAMASRRSSGGGFGHVIPNPTSTGGG